ncbi:hypothetical protein ACHAWF_004654 [Thalassiosira exigua]
MRPPISMLFLAIAGGGAFLRSAAAFSRGAVGRRAPSERPSADRRGFRGFRGGPRPLDEHARTTGGDEDDGGGSSEIPSVHRKRYCVAGTGRGSAVDVRTDTGHALRTDLPRAMGGEDTAPQPVEHLLAALLGCAQATAVYVGRRMDPRLPVERLEFEIEAERDQRGALEVPIDEAPSTPARLRRVSGTVAVYFKGRTKASDEQMKVLAEQTEARCPVADMMRASGCVMDISWVNGVDK